MQQLIRPSSSNSYWKAASALQHAQHLNLHCFPGISLPAACSGTQIGTTAGGPPCCTSLVSLLQHHSGGRLRLLCTGPRLKDDLLTPANMVSLARVFSSPIVAHFILQEQWAPALGLLAVAGASDWLDGHLARRHNDASVLGSYLDPFADKVLIGCVVGALMYKSLFPLWLGALIVGRDTALVGVSFYMRFRQLGWKWPGAEAFFKSRPGGASGVPTAARVEPLMVSKVNTVLQLLTVASCLTSPAVGYPGADVISGLALLTGATTAWSGVAYGRLFWQRMK